MKNHWIDYLDADRFTADIEDALAIHMDRLNTLGIAKTANQISKFIEGESELEQWALGMTASLLARTATSASESEINLEVKVLEVFSLEELNAAKEAFDAQ